MANSFFDGRKQIKAEDLKGPRVYSTDMLPAHFDPAHPRESVVVAARALKIKILTKGLVTLNSTYLVSPLGVLLLDTNPDLFEGEAVLPAFRTDKTSLSELIASTGGHAHVGIADVQLQEHIKKLESSIKQVMPWHLGDVGKTYQAAVVKGLRSPTSLVAIELVSAHGLQNKDLERIAGEIESLDFGDSVNLRQYVAGLPPDQKAPLARYTSACYHAVGTGVVRCETGTDLSPLSNFKAADVILAARDGRPEKLSDDALFLEAFMGNALDSIQASVLPTQIVDSLSFGTVHKISKALREQGFQQKYDDIISRYVTAIDHDNSEEALAQLDEGSIATVAAELAKTFQREIISELPDYETAIQSDSKQSLYRSGTDIALDAVGIVPGLGNVISLVDLIKDLSSVSGDLADAFSVRDQRKAFSEAHQRRTEKIEAAVQSLKTSSQKKAKLLDAVALLSDVHALSVKRA